MALIQSGQDLSPAMEHSLPYAEQMPNREIAAPPSMAFAQGSAYATRGQEARSGPAAYNPSMDLKKTPDEYRRLDYNNYPVAG